VDATDRAALTEARDRILATHGAIHGVVHSALVLEDVTLARMDEAALFRALDAKTRTSVCLGEVFGGDDLDFMLFFSSVNSFVRAPGQANYAAGCMFKDAFAQRMARTVHYPVKIVNWGYWGTVGVGANEDIARRVAVYGLSSIDPERSLVAIERLLAAPGGQFAYLAVHRPITELGLPVAADPASAATHPAVLRPGNGAGSAIDSEARLADWLAADKSVATFELSSHLRGIAGTILGLREDQLDMPSRPFADAMLGALGMDSLLASNLRNHLLQELKVDIPVQVLIGEPVAVVVDQIHQQLLLRQLAAAPGERQIDGDFETLVF
jgi:hypothetical protein